MIERLLERSDVLNEGYQCRIEKMYLVNVSPFAASPEAYTIEKLMSRGLNED